MAEETTFYRFLSEIRAFLSKLLRDPIKAEPSQYLKEREFTRKKLENLLIKKHVLERHEKIMDSTNSDEETPKYTVTYKVRKQDFETRIHRIYIQYFEKNEPEKEKKDVNESIRECGITMGVVGGGKKGETADRWAKYINDNDKGFTRSVFKDEDKMKEALKKDPRDKEAYEKRGGIKECDCGGAGATGCSSVGDMAYDVVSGTVNQGEIYAPKGRGYREKEKGNNNKPENILGKTLTAEKKKPRKIYITEEQYKMLTEEGGVTSTTSVGSMGNYTANGLVLKTSDGKEDPCAKAGHIKVKTVMDV